MANSYFPKEEYEQRWQRVHAEMTRRDFETAVVWGRTGAGFDRAADILYLANYTSTKVGQAYDVAPYNARAYSAAILRAGETPELHADDPWPRADLVATDRIAWHADPIAGVADALNTREIEGPVAFVGTDFFPVKYWRELEALTPRVEWVPADDLVRRVRLVKSPRELDCVREAGAICSRALEGIMKSLIAGNSQAEAVAEAAAEIILGGGVPERIKCVHGELIGHPCQDPFRGFSDEAPSTGDLARSFVVGPMFQGYYLDPGRTAVVGGRPSPEQRELLEACVEIVEQVAASIRPGMLFREPADVGDRLVAEFAPDKDAFSDKFPFYGHSVGLYFETPYISNVLGNDADRFETGMVLGVEAFITRKGVGSAGFEQNVIVHEDGVEVLTTPPMLWH